MENATPEQRQLLEMKQLQSFLQQYNQLSESCFDACVHDFTNRKISSNESTCALNCAEKYIKMTQRLTVRLQESQLMQTGASPV